MSMRRVTSIFLVFHATLHLLAGEADPSAAIKPFPEMLPRYFQKAYQTLEAARPRPPADLEGFKRRSAEIRARHARALGIPLEHQPRPVAWRTVGVIEREDYRIHRIIFESRRGLPVPALLYIPKGGTSAPHPAVLSVHGHWREGKRATPVQLRNIFLAKRGYVVLALDAIGAGERAYRDPEKGPITYHGRQLGYGILPSGKTLAGLQIEDNRRAIDLLASLPEVDPKRIGCTGASGGGNQTFNLTVMDERIRAAVAVCFYGAYRGYLEGAHCACEMVPGVLRYAEEGDVAGSVAPRALLIIAAMRDRGAAFRIEDARKNIELAQRYYKAAGAPGRCRLAEFDCGHDYNKEMREAMVAFFNRHLRGVDHGDRVPEPELKPEDLEAIRCFGPEGPEGPEILTVPAIAWNISKKLVANFREKGDLWSDRNALGNLRRMLMEDIFGGFPADAPLDSRGAEVLITEPGIEVRLVKTKGLGEPKRALVILAGGGERYRKEGLREIPEGILLIEAFPRGTGPTTWPAANTVSCSDYLLAQGTGVLGNPMLGMWVFDALNVVEHLKTDHPEMQIGLYGEGVMGTVAILAAALSDHVAAVGTVDSLDRYAWPARFDDRWPLSIFVPGILRLGDLPEIAGAIPPRPLIQGSLRDGGGAVVGPTGAIDPREVLTKMLGGLERAAGPAPPLKKALWRITPLHTGLCSMGKNHLLGDPYTDEERVPFSLISFLLEGPGGEIALVDFGPKDPAYFNESFRRYGLFRERAGDRENPDDVVQPEGNVLDHLKRLGIPKEQVKHIIFTHLHYDHVGGSRPPDPGLLRDFPGALVHVSKRGWEDNLSRRKDGWRWTSYVDFEVSQEIFIRGKEGRARFEDDVEIRPGIRTRHLGGHSVCSQAVLVDTAEGTAVIAGDVVYHFEYLEKAIVARLRTTAGEYISAIKRLVQLVEQSGGILLPVHDPKILEAHKARGERWLSALKPLSDRSIKGYQARKDSMRVLEKHRNKG